MEYRHTPPSLEELVEQRKESLPITKRSVLTSKEKFAVFMTHKVGSLGFFFLLLVWTTVWLGWNIGGPSEYRFDPAPAFVIWLFASNILQLVLLPLIMVGQNIEARTADKRAEEDFLINKKAEKEIETVIAHLENQNELLLELTRKIDRR